MIDEFDMAPVAWRVKTDGQWSKWKTAKTGLADHLMSGRPVEYAYSARGLRSLADTKQDLEHLMNAHLGISRATNTLELTKRALDEAKSMNESLASAAETVLSLIHAIKEAAR